MKASCVMLQSALGTKVDLMPGEGIGRGDHRLQMRQHDVPRHVAELCLHDGSLELHSRTHLGLYVWEKRPNGSWTRAQERRERLVLSEGLVFGLLRRRLARVEAVQLPTERPRVEVFCEGAWHPLTVESSRRHCWIRASPPGLQAIRTPDTAWHLWGWDGRWHLEDEPFRPGLEFESPLGARLRTVVATLPSRPPTAPTKRRCELLLPADSRAAVRVCLGSLEVSFEDHQATVLRHLGERAYTPVARPTLIRQIYKDRPSKDPSRNFRNTLFRLRQRAIQHGLPPLLEDCDRSGLRRDPDGGELPVNTHLRLSPEVGVLRVA